MNSSVSMTARVMARSDMTFQEWKEKYIQRIMFVCNVRKTEAETMIASDPTLFEIYEDGYDPVEAADEEMSYWSE